MEAVGTEAAGTAGAAKAEGRAEAVLMEEEALVEGARVGAALEEAVRVEAAKVVVVMGVAAPVAGDWVAEAASAVVATTAAMEKGVEGKEAAGRAQGAQVAASEAMEERAEVASVTVGLRGEAHRRAAGWQSRSHQRGSFVRSCSTE